MVPVSPENDELPGRPEDYRNSRIIIFSRMAEITLSRSTNSESPIQSLWFRVSGRSRQHSRSGLSRQIGLFVSPQAVSPQAGLSGDYRSRSVKTHWPVSARRAPLHSQAQRPAPESSSRHYHISCPVTGPGSPFLSQRRHRSIPALPDVPADDDPRHCVDQSSEGASDHASPRWP